MRFTQPTIDPYEPGYYTLTVVAPPGRGSVDVTITNAGGTSAAVADNAFTYWPTAVITELSTPCPGGTAPYTRPSISPLWEFRTVGDLRRTWLGASSRPAAAFHDQRHLRELYHELTHQWNVRDVENPSPRWNEGLASFLEDLLQERLDGWQGRAATDTWIITTLKSAIASDSSVRTVPFIDCGRHDITDRSYTVGNAMFEVLYDLVGEEEFNRIVGGYNQQFVDGGTTRDFVDFARRMSRLDLSTFFNDWIFTTGWTVAVAQGSSLDDVAGHYRAIASPKR